MNFLALLAAVSGVCLLGFTARLQRRVMPELRMSLWDTMSVGERILLVVLATTFMGLGGVVVLGAL